MKNTFEKRFSQNLKIIQNKNPELFKKILDRGTRINLITANNGLATFKYKVLFIESRINPGRISIDEINSTIKNDKKGGNLIFLGSGLAYHINHLFGELYGKYNGEAIVIEKELDILTAAFFIIEPYILGNLTVVSDENYDETIDKIKNLNFSKIRIIKHPISTKLHREYYSNIESYIRGRIREETASSITTKNQKKLWERNILKNIINIKDEKYFNTADMAGRFKGPVILVASGPSVERVKRSLEKLRGSIPIISLLPSLKFLMHNNILPDAAFTTDPGFWNKERFLKAENIPLFTTFSVNPIITKNWIGKVFYFNHNLDLEDDFYEITGNNLKIPMQGTSSIVMLLFARILGFSPIYLTGFDFCGVGLKDHHSGAGFDSYLLLESKRTHGWYSKMVKRLTDEGINKVSGTDNIYTTYKLMLYKNWMEKWIVKDDLFNISEIWPIMGVKKVDPETIKIGKETNKAKFNLKFRSNFKEFLLQEHLIPVAKSIHVKPYIDLLIGRARMKLDEIKKESRIELNSGRIKPEAKGLLDP